MVTLRRGPRQDERARLSARVMGSINAGNVAGARIELNHALALRRAWEPADLAQISRYVRLVNEGVPLHRVPVPAQPEKPAAESVQVIEPSSYSLGTFEMIDGEPTSLEGLSGRRPLPRPGIKVWRIPDATVVHVKGAFLVKDARGATLGDSSGRGSAPLDDLYQPILDAKDVEIIDGRALLLLDGTDGRNYSHWMLDQLTRLAVYELAGVTPGVLLVDTVASGFHRETLAMKQDLITGVVEMRRVPAVRVKELFVATNVGVDLRHPAHRVDSWAIDFLRRDIPGLGLGLASRDSLDLLYVSRSDADRRQVVNEDELVAMLGTRGFSAVTLGGMSVVEQASMFGRARAIVSAHGAGLTNLVFSSSGTEVLELFPGSYGTPAFCLISRVLGQSYAAMTCEAVRNEGGTPNTDDLRVDIAAVESWLDGALARRLAIDEE